MYLRSVSVAMLRVGCARGARFVPVSFECGARETLRRSQYKKWNSKVNNAHKRALQVIDIMIVYAWEFTSYFTAL